MISRWRRFSTTPLFGFSALGLVAVGLTAWCVWLVHESDRQWQEFKREHRCKAVTKMQGEVFNTVAFDAKGNVVVGLGSAPDKTGWLCDDGVTYYR